MIPFTLGPWPETPIVAFVDQPWTREQVNAVIALGESRTPQAATLVRGYELETKRKTTIAWLKCEDTAITQTFLDIATTALAVNKSYWNFDLWGYIDSLQYTVYGVGDEFGWHVDCGPKLPPRKLSVTIQLSDPADYDGGDLQLRVSEEVTTAPRTQGSITVFPSFISHRVTPVTRGVRKALVAWIAGPAFR